MAVIVTAHIRIYPFKSRSTANEAKLTLWRWGICGIYHAWYIDLFVIIHLNRDLRRMRPNWHHGGYSHSQYDRATLFAGSKAPYFGYLRYMSCLIYRFIRNYPFQSRSTANEAKLTLWRCKSQPIFVIIHLNRDLRRMRPNWHHGGDSHSPYDRATLSAGSKAPYFRYLRYI